MNIEHLKIFNRLAYNIKSNLEWFCIFEMRLVDEKIPYEIFEGTPKHATDSPCFKVGSYNIWAHSGSEEGYNIFGITGYISTIKKTDDVIQFLRNRTWHPLTQKQW